MGGLSTSAVRERRQALLADRRLVGPGLRAALTELHDGWLADLLGVPGPGLALVDVGSLGRRGCAPGSDLDLVLVHAPRRDDVAQVADRLWYAVWDSGTRLDHSVRTVAGAVRVAGADLRAALGLLEARHLAGDAALTAELTGAARAACVVDAFYVVGHDGQPLRDPARRRRVVAEVLARLAVDPRGSAAGPPEPD